MPLLLNEVGSAMMVMLDSVVSKLPKFSFAVAFIVALHLAPAAYGISRVRISSRALNTTIA